MWRSAQALGERQFDGLGLNLQSQLPSFPCDTARHRFLHCLSRVAYSNAVAGDTPVDQISYWQRLFSGGTAGAVGIAIANGTDLLKVRMQADRDGTRYTKGTFNAFKQIVQTEGVLGLWAGVGPNMQRAYIVNAAELATYDQVRLLKEDGKGREEMWCRVAASAGLAYGCSFQSSPLPVPHVAGSNAGQGIYREHGLPQGDGHGDALCLVLCGGLHGRARQQPRRPRQEQVASVARTDAMVLRCTQAHLALNACF